MQLEDSIAEAENGSNTAIAPCKAATVRGEVITNVKGLKLLNQFMNSKFLR